MDDEPGGGAHARLTIDAASYRLYVEQLVSDLPEQLFFKDLDSRFVYVSRSHAEAFGSTAEDLIGKSDFDFFPEQHARRAFDDEQNIIRTGQAHELFEVARPWPDKPTDWMLISKYPLRDETGTIVGTCGISRDITRRVTAEAAERERSAELVTANDHLKAVEQELRTLLEGSPDAVVKLDLELRHVYVNPRAADVLGLSESEILGRSNRELGRPTGGLALWEETVRRVLETGVPAELESSHDTDRGRLFIHSRLAPLLGDDGQVTAVLVASRDLTDRKAAEEALAHQAVHDPVTGLANRVLLMDRIARALGRLDRQPAVVAALFIDLDKFKTVNDTLGHAVGDAVLQEVARRLNSTVRRGDTVARLGGDEFVVLCESLTDDELIRVLAERILVALSRPIRVEGQEITVGASIGIATSGDANASAEDLVRDADAAMYQAKGRGRGGYDFFDAAVRARANARLAMEAALRQALERREFHVVYQPLMSLADSSITGFEALIRWDHPDRGLLLPADFIAVAEEARLIVAIDRWVLDEACGQLASWNAQRVSAPLTIAVNMSGRHLSEPDFVEAVDATIKRHSLDAQLVCLEITETAMLRDLPAAQDVCERLALLGVRIALDDFGTGFSSLGHLRHLPVSILKIDQSFVGGLNATGGDAAIIEAVSAMAHALGMTTVGEGIETDEQLAQLRALGCDSGQGYLLARPARAADFDAVLRAT